MIYKRFYLSVILQVVLLALTPLVFLWAWSREYMLVTSYSLILFWIFQISYLIWYINKTNRDLSRFFNAFKYQDSTLIFNEKKNDPAFKHLHQSFNDIIRAFGKVKIEKEKDFTFFQHTVQHVGIGLLAFNQKGEIRLCNGAFLELFHLSRFKAVEELAAVEEDFPNFLKGMRTGKQRMKKFLIDSEIRKLLVKAEEFRLEHEHIKLLSFQDIKNEIEQGEMEAWQKLIRVFTHEIMNSVSPITLLATSLINIYEKNGKQPCQHLLSEGVMSNTLMGLQTIRKRSKGLTAFVEEYRNLTHLPKPHFELFSVRRLFQRMETLFREEFHRRDVEFLVDLPDDEVEVIADEQLLEQVLINLIRNSLQALNGQSQAQVQISGCFTQPVSCIQVRDNGPGIPTEIQENIFTPFFTTKETGSGIGLSLSRQIMRLHGGSISVKSDLGRETVFTLQF